MVATSVVAVSAAMLPAAAASAASLDDDVNDLLSVIARGAGPTVYAVIDSGVEALQSFDFVVDGQPAILESRGLGNSEFVLVSSAVTGDVVNIQFNRYETSQVAYYGATAAALFTAACGLAGSVVAGAICAAYGAYHVGVANDALAQDKCYGQQFLTAVSGAVYPVMYSGGNCR